MALTKQTARQVQLNPGIMKQIATKDDELQERYSGEAEMPVHVTAQFYNEVYGLDEY